MLAHKAEIDACHTTKKTVPSAKDTDDSSVDEAIFPPSKRTRRRPSRGTRDEGRSFDGNESVLHLYFVWANIQLLVNIFNFFYHVDIFAQLSSSDSENDQDRQPMISPIEAIEGRSDHLLRDTNAYEVGQLRSE